MTLPFHYLARDEALTLMDWYGSRHAFVIRMKNESSGSACRGLQNFRLDVHPRSR